MNFKSIHSLLIATLLALTAMGCVHDPRVTAAPSAAAMAEVAVAPPPATLTRFVDRVSVSRRQLRRITAAAEAAAKRKADHPEALVNLTYSLQPAFGEDLLNRSGGLAGALPSDERQSLITDHDIVVFSIRSWQTNGEAGVKYLEHCRARGWLTILFASAAGRPENLDVDFFIDNGAAGGGEDEGPLNLIANVLNGWLWVCEYAAALTRHGKHPGFLQSITTPGSSGHNKIYQKKSTRHHIYPCDTSVPAVDLARIYLRRVDRLISDLSGPTTRTQIDKAADIIAHRLASGGKVVVSTSTHIMLNDIYKNNQTPWKPVNTLRRMPEALAEHVNEGDLFFWLGFNGVSIWWYPQGGPSRMYIDYDTSLRQAKVDLITCFATDPLHPGNNGDGALAHIEQNWDFGDSVVPVPFPPGRIAPISGLYQALLYRMLDEVAAARLVPDH